jgi:hypothetical protein
METSPVHVTTLSATDETDETDDAFADVITPTGSLASLGSVRICLRSTGVMTPNPKALFRGGMCARRS